MFKDKLRKWKDARDLRRLRRDIAHLPDHLLRDIGLDRRTGGKDVMGQILRCGG